MKVCEIIKCKTGVNLNAVFFYKEVNAFIVSYILQFCTDNVILHSACRYATASGSNFFIHIRVAIDLIMSTLR